MSNPSATKTVGRAAQVLCLTVAEPCQSILEVAGLTARKSAVRWRNSLGVYSQIKDACISRLKLLVSCHTSRGTLTPSALPHFWSVPCRFRDSCGSRSCVQCPDWCIEAVLGPWCSNARIFGPVRRNEAAQRSDPSCDEVGRKMGLSEVNVTKKVPGRDEFWRIWHFRIGPQSPFRGSSALESLEPSSSSCDEEPLVPSITGRPLRNGLNVVFIAPPDYPECEYHPSSTN